jgi:hypothetical protein
MRRFEFVTVDVFAEARFGGNPLAVFPRAEGLTDTEMQALAAELNLSETTFVLPPDSPDNTVPGWGRCSASRSRPGWSKCARPGPRTAR